MAVLNGQNLSKLDILRRVSDMRQLAGAIPFELVDGAERGTRGVRLYNAAGLDMNVITDRGMGITELSWRGTQLALLTPIGAAHPAFTEQPGLGWLRTWPGGFVTVCGLSQVGSPALDGGEELGQHGRAAATPARGVTCGGSWEGEEYSLWVEGTLREGVVFGPQLALRRKVTMKLDQARFWIEDCITNESFHPAPLMLLQHFNLGFPLLDAGAELELPPGEVLPRDQTAAAGLADWARFQPPQAGYSEQVFYHDPQPDEAGWVQVRLRNRAAGGGNGVGVYWKYRKADYPVLVEWKMMAEGLYVLGVEPANCHVEGRARERERGTLQVLAPHENRTFVIEVGFSQE